MPKWSQITSSQFQAQPLFMPPVKDQQPQQQQHTQDQLLQHQEQTFKTQQPQPPAKTVVNKSNFAKATTTVQITRDETKVESSLASGVAHSVNLLSKKIRLFVALFDYDPPTMSPNPEACDEELPFREGQLIKVYGEKDADGFYWGEAGNRDGYVPCNMVSEVQVEDDRVAEELFKEQSNADTALNTAGALGKSISATYVRMT